MTGLKLAIFAVVGLLVLGLARGRAAGKEEHGFVHRTYKDADGKSHKYVVFVPYAYNGTKPFPVILFLHGAGERAGGTKEPVDVGIGPAIRKYGEKKFPFFVVIPRCDAAPHSWQANGPDAQRALAMLDEVEKAYKIDPGRQYLTGLSMGGYGTWSLAAKYPNRWAAIVPVCGGAGVRERDPMKRMAAIQRLAEKIKDIPCWCFHGDADPAVNVEQSREIIKALKEAGGKPKYTEYPGVGHNSWDRAYGTAQLYEWLLKHESKPKSAAGG
jgi:predicted peptidase